MNNNQWQIQDFEKVGGNDIAVADPMILKEEEGLVGNMRHAFMITHFCSLLNISVQYNFVTQN